LFSVCFLSALATASFPDITIGSCINGPVIQDFAASSVTLNLLVVKLIISNYSNLLFSFKKKVFWRMVRERTSERLF
jgi:hypothetical protein